MLIKFSWVFLWLIPGHPLPINIKSNIEKNLDSKCEISILNEPSEIKCESPGMILHVLSIGLILLFSLALLIISLLDMIEWVFFLIISRFRVNAIAPHKGDFDLSRLQNIPIGDVYFLYKLKENVSSSEYSDIYHKLQINNVHGIGHR